MKKIGGNTTAYLQIKTSTPNEIGELVPSWTTVMTFVGWLDMMGGEASFRNYNAKIQESTHVFVADFDAGTVVVDDVTWVPTSKELQKQDGDIVVITEVTPDVARLLVNGDVYDISFVDDPMELHYQWEFYLKFVGGGQNVS